MSVLSNTAIWSALDRGHFKITPEPERTIEGLQPGYDSDSVNLRLGNVFLRPRKGGRFDPHTQNIKQFLANNCDQIVVPEDGQIVLAPGELLLGMTLEKITFPPVKRSRKKGEKSKPAYMGLIYGRTTSGRCGFTAASVDAPVLHNGNNHPITLEFFNAGVWEIVLRPGMTICQMLVIKLDGNPRCRLGTVHGQTSPTGWGTIPPELGVI